MAKTKASQSLDDAIGALEQQLSQVQILRSRQRAALVDAQAERRATLQHVIDSNLLTPPLESRTYQILCERFPEFMQDQAVESTFQRVLHPSLFLKLKNVLFEDKEADQHAYDLVRVKFTSYIDNQNYGSLAALSEKIKKLADSSTLAERELRISSTLKQLKQVRAAAEAKKIDLRKIPSGTLTKLTAAAAAARQVPPVPTTVIHEHHYHDDGPDLFTLMMYSNMINSTFHTTPAAQPTFQGGGGDFGGGGATGSWDASTTVRAVETAQEERTSPLQSISEATAFVSAGAVVDNIATDDSLGRFS